MKKALTALLLLSALLFCACSETAENPEDPGTVPSNTTEDGSPAAETAPPETEIDAADRVPEMKFEKEMHFLLPDVSWLTRDIITDEITGERVNDAQNSMKLAMEERFGTTLSETFTGDIWSTNYITRLVSSGDDSFDVCYSLDLYAPGYIVADVVTPYTDVEYIDLSRVYWDQSILKCMTVNGTPYCAFGAYDLSYYDFTHSIVFNKDLVADYGLENPYVLVRDGSWNVDKFFTLAKTVLSDLDGAGQMKRKTDSWGFISEPKQVLPCFGISSGELSINKDEKDLPYLNIVGNDRFYSVFDKVYNIMWDGGIWCNDQAGIDYWKETAAMFGESRVLFVDEIFYRLNELRDVEVDFGIVPYPLFDDTQAEYYSRVEAGARIGMIPITNKHPEYAGALLEAMASYGYQNLIPEYYEVALKRRTSRDSESSEMLDLIFATRRYDLGDTWWCNELRDGLFKNMFAEDDRDLASGIASKEKIINKTLSKVIEKLSQ
jgi:ABC-type glycerol-3-phosphate transport system substrate-binding protein